MAVIDDEHDPEATVAWEQDIARRAAEVEAGTAETVTLAEYRAHRRAQCEMRIRR